MTQPARIPNSTYRLQFHRDFTFQDARKLVDYLDALGITDCYSSPYMKANPGSTHGYDIGDHTHLNPEIGSEEDYDAFTAQLAQRGMGQVLDFVPNHMGVNAATNPWWRDVLENGHLSPFVRCFDIDWHPIKAELNQKVLLPILGDPYGLVLERGELRLELAEGAFVLHYFDHNLPISPRSGAQILRHRLAALQAEIPDTERDMREYLSIITALGHLPFYTETAPEKVAERQREKEVTRERLQRLLASSQRLRRFVEDNVTIFNGQPGEPTSFDLLHRLLEVQVYRLANWRTASHEINYRRFFDINSLVGLRMEDPAVFEAAHTLVRRLIAAGKVTGLRIDHIDGLFDPAEYLRRLQAMVQHDRHDGGDHALFVVVEKILSAGESLPENWAVHGTSGYDFANDVNGLFVDSRGARAMRRVYERFTGQRVSFADVVYESKRLIMATSMASELNLLGQALNRLSEDNRRTRDFTLNSLRQVLREVVACFPVYRTYISADAVSGTDRHQLETAIRHARRRNPTVEPSLFDFLREVLLAESAAACSSAENNRRLEFAMKFQQYTGPVQAKGVEDTAFYRYNLLLSLNEVGGDPQRFGRSPAEFHQSNAYRQQHWPATMLASATHDTKRGEDVRARLNVLSEMPDEWGRAISKWARLNARHRSRVDGDPAPDRNDEYLLYQTLIGAWPLAYSQTKPLSPDDPFISRLKEYMLKAARESKVHTSWLTTNRAYEDAVTHFAERILTAPGTERFLARFLPMQARVARLGMFNSLAQVVLKIASPGIPDFYQGTELWDLTLVDPDNRRPVDYARREELLRSLQPLLSPDPTQGEPQAAGVRALLEHWEDGRIKLFVIACGLRLRRHFSDVFQQGSYEALTIQGRHADQLVGFARHHAGRTVLTLVPRLLARLLADGLPLGEGFWGDSSVALPPQLAGHEYRNVFTGESVSAAEGSLGVGSVFQTVPVALLHSR